MYFKIWCCIGCLILFGCTENKKEVSLSELEAARKQTSDNASFNAKRYISRNPKYTGWSIIPSIDSSQNIKCPSGDGWVTVTIINPLFLNQETRIKCSTTSATIGCMTDSEFSSKENFVKEDGGCNNLELPIVKLIQ